MRNDYGDIRDRKQQRHMPQALCRGHTCKQANVLQSHKRNANDICSTGNRLADRHLVCVISLYRTLRESSYGGTSEHYHPPMMMMIYRYIHRLYRYLRFEFCTAVTMKNAIFWVLSPCGSYKNRHFGGT
jgi:hypothetical protein